MSGNGRARSLQTAPDGLRPAASNGLGHSRVAEVQRARLLSAITAELAERDAASVSVANVVARAGVSRRTFYELFDDRDDCLLAALDDALARATRCVLELDDPAAPWAERIRTAVGAILSFLDAQGDAGRLLILGSLGAGPQAMERRRRVLAQMTAVVDEGRAQARAGAEPPPLTAEGVVGGVLSIVQARIAQAAPRASLTDLTGELTGMIVLPYLGVAAARREARRPAPRSAALPPPQQGDPLQGLQMRLTYRTIRVLTAIAELGGRGSDPSNRRIGEAAEIGDQGQVSKLLARLRRLGLIENGGEGAATRGEPNAWRLTPRGARVHETLVALGD
jgi:AcrR family transcriptional regulator